MSERPLLAITMGDAAGIGAEVTAKALQDKWVYEKTRPFVVGSAAAMNAALDLIGASGTAKIAHSVDDVVGEHGNIDVLDLENLDYGHDRIRQDVCDCGQGVRGVDTQGGRACQQRRGSGYRHSAHQ